MIRVGAWYYVCRHFARENLSVLWQPGENSVLLLSFALHRVKDNAKITL